MEIIETFSKDSFGIKIGVCIISISLCKYGCPEQSYYQMQKSIERYVSWLGTTRKNEKIPKLIYFIYQYQRLSSAYCEAFVMLNSFKYHARIQRGGRGGPEPPWNLQSLISPILLEIKKNQLFFIFVHFHSYTSRLDPPPSLEKFSGSAP